jgi:predicted RND superfamily exporter protein
MTGLRGPSDYTAMIRDTRAVTDRQLVPSFTAGFVYNFYSQYLNVRQHLWQHLIYVAIGVGAVSMLFLLHPGMTFIMICVIATIVAEVFGLMPFFGLDLNGVSVINVIVAVGVSVEFTAHIGRVFMTSTGTRAERVEHALQEMIAPVLAGAMSTVLGVLPLAFAAFPYFQLYFFNMYMLIVLCGVFNGLCTLPALLSLAGPKSLALSAK